MTVLTCEDLSVTFLPEKGMNFVSLRRGEVEVIDQSTRGLFEERSAGLGAMIGPHFHHRKVVPPVPNEEAFPHIASIRAKGGNEPFSHGIGRYAPWRVVKQGDRELHAQLRGEDRWHDVPLKELEGQDFTLNYIAKLLPEGLHIDLSVESAHPSVVGLHTYYALDGKGTVRAQVQSEYRDGETLRPIPPEWKEGERLAYAVDQPADYGFRPAPNLREGSIELETGDRRVAIHYRTETEENSWQLWHPENASFVCMEPLSASNPRQPKLSASRLEILIML